MPGAITPPWRRGSAPTRRGSSRSFLRRTGPLGDLPLRYVEALLDGDRQTTCRLVLAAAEAGAPVRDLYLDVFQAAQHEIGRLWQMNRVSVAQEHFCSAATQPIMSQLYDRIFSVERSAHALVANTPTRSVLETIADRAADALAISVTMTPHVKQVAELARSTPVASCCGAMTGGASGRSCATR